MSDDRYFELNDDVGVTADGNLEPLVAQGLTLTIPTITDGELVDVAYSISIQPARGIAADEHARVVPGTRIVHTRDPRIASALLATGHYGEVDSPSKREVSSQQKTTQDAREEAGTHTDTDEEVNG